MERPVNGRFKLAQKGKALWDIEIRLEATGETADGRLLLNVTDRNVFKC